jgi:hypothetical protein
MFVYIDRAYPTTLHTMSQLFMIMLMDKFCWTLIAQVLSVNLLCAEKMFEFCGCCSKFVWSDTLPEDWETTKDLVLWRPRCMS